MKTLPRLSILLLLCFWVTLTLFGCSAKKPIKAELTGYDLCQTCCGFEYGFPDFWNRYVSVGPRKGQPYTGKTASGTTPRTPYPGLLSANTLSHPWTLPHRLLLPWLWSPHCGTAAADTQFHSFGTKIYVDGYGCAIVEDRGSAIKGYGRFDLFFSSHEKALAWGRKSTRIFADE
jgi:hypothetical protein